MAKTVRMKVEVETVGNVFLSFLGTVSADEVNYREYEITDGTSDESVNLAGITTVDVLYAEANVQLTYKLNGSSTAITLDANKPHLLGGTSITAMTVSNAAGSTAVLKLLLAGT